MKHFLPIILILLIGGSASAAGIMSIEGPSSPCPGKSVTYKVEFLMTYGGYTSELVYKVNWEFTQNGVVVYSKSVGTALSGLVGVSSHTISAGLPPGPTKIKVKLEYYTITMGIYVPGTTSKTREIYVGLKAPEDIEGNDYICLTGGSVLSAEAVSGATSYTWEVPAGWKVNGILGPIVPNQGSLVGILPCTDGSCPTFSSHTIKVKGVSATCGEGSYASKTITIDQPITITESNISTTRAKLTVNQTALPSYIWSVPAAWTYVTGTNTNAVSFTHNKVSGPATVVAKTSCNNTYTRTYYFIPPAQPGDPGWPGDPNDPNPGDCNGPEEPVIYATAAKGNNLAYLKDPCGETIYQAALYDYVTLKPIALSQSKDGYEFDISSLKAGAYILNVKTSSGKKKTMKFIKLD